MKTSMTRTLATLAALVSVVSFCACGRHEPKPEDAVEPPEDAALEAAEPEGPELAKPEAVEPRPAKPQSARSQPAKSEQAKTGLAKAEAPARSTTEPAAKADAPAETDTPAADEAPGRKDDREKPVFETLEAQACYALGLQIGFSLVEQGVKFDADAVGRGIADSVAGKPKMDANEFRATLEAHWKNMREGEASKADENTCYALGLDIAKNLGGQGLDLVPKDLTRGIADAIAGTPGMDEAEIKATMIALKGHTEEKARRVDRENLEKGRAWLAENAKRPGITTLPSGLQYEVLAPGDGLSPGPRDRVTTHYRGTLINGTVFDSSYDRGRPATFPVGGVIKGWTEALQLMKVGAKWKLYIPSRLGYGERPRPGGKIKPNDALIFEIELLKIE